MSTEEVAVGAPPEPVENPAVSFTVTPERIGRYREPEQFDVDLPEHFRTTANVLASHIYRHIKPCLLSKEFFVSVDMAKGTFKIDGGRFGRGTFTQKGD